MKQAACWWLEGEGENMMVASSESPQRGSAGPPLPPAGLRRSVLGSSAADGAGFPGINPGNLNTILDGPSRDGDQGFIAGDLSQVNGRRNEGSHPEDPGCPEDHRRRHNAARARPGCAGEETRRQVPEAEGSAAGERQWPMQGRGGRISPNQALRPPGAGRTIAPRCRPMQG
uniref:Uncharacterized protein n=1 Tax=Sphaerodactylus townsendi TaxID=933632 RepID=A0ACB8G0G5_9SAUR